MVIRPAVRRIPRVLVMLAGLLLPLLPSLASPSLAVAAPSASDRAAAEVLFDEAIKLLETGDAATACPKLEESQRLDPGVGTLLYLADCYRAQGRTASAWATFREASYAAEAAGQADRMAIANTEADKLKPSLSTVTLVIADREATSLDVQRDGEAVNRALWGSPIPVDPGEHQFAASAPGKATWSKTVVVPKGPASVTIDIPALEAAPTQAAPAAGAAAHPPTQETAPAPTAGSGSSQTTWGWVAIGVGGAGIVVGSVFGVLASQDNQAADDECRPDDATRCNQQGVDLAESAASKATLSTVAFGVGLAAATTGVVLLLTAPSNDTASGKKLWLNASANAERASLDLTGVW